MKKALIRTELFALVLIVGLTLIFGLNKGVWDESSFYKLNFYGNKRVFSRNSQHASFCQVEDNRQEFVLSSDGKLSASFIVEMAENDPTQTIRFLPANSDKVFTFSFYKADVDRVVRPEDMWRIRNYLLETAQLDCSISDKGLWKMASGQERVKFLGRPSATLLAILFLSIGLAVTCLQDSLIKLEQSLIGLFYNNANELQPRGFSKVCWLFLGVILFGIGLVLSGIMLLG